MVDDYRTLIPSDDDEDFLDGDAVEEGEAVVEWAIRAYHVHPDNADGKTVQFDWVVDDVRGGYTESDWYFDSVEEAKADLGVE